MTKRYGTEKLLDLTPRMVGALFTALNDPHGICCLCDRRTALALERRGLGEAGRLYEFILNDKGLKTLQRLKEEQDTPKSRSERH